MTPIGLESFYSGSLFRKFCFFQQQGFHIGKDQAGIERAGTVDVPNATFAIDEKDAQGVVKRALWIGRVGRFCRRPDRRRQG